MNEEILDDIRMILRDRTLLSKFIKIDDIGDMYNFCKNLKEKDERAEYSEEEFSVEVENLIGSLPESIYDSNEW